MPYPHKYIHLTPAEREKIAAELKRLVIAHQFKARRRLQVIYLSDSGLDYQQISERLNMPYMTVRRCIYAFKKEGFSAHLLTGKATSQA